MSGIDKTRQHKFPHVRGLILMDMEAELPEVITIDLEGYEVEFTLDYEELPEGCFTCHEVLHKARDCPHMIVDTRVADPKEIEEAIRATEAKKLADAAKKHQGQKPQPTRSTGQLDILWIPRRGERKKAGMSWLNTQQTGDNLQNGLHKKSRFDVLGESTSDQEKEETVRIDSDTGEDPIPETSAMIDKMRDIRGNTSNELTGTEDEDMNLAEAAPTGENEAQGKLWGDAEEEDEDDVVMDSKDSEEKYTKSAYEVEMEKIQELPRNHSGSSRRRS
ncbi:hypothetical protein R1sor_020736 [Riccia sorocarpa]|uniref:Zinc knuckle CX2CX4HX4C domain-containing protein n=1 Tax=Riccia sorocarpa TaxID=122646 RepID=A0ABD3GI72_9MARC